MYEGVQIILDYAQGVLQKEVSYAQGGTNPHPRSESPRQLKHPSPPPPSAHLSKRTASEVNLNYFLD